MNIPLYFAKRYLMAKKSHNAINVISAISVAGVAVGTFALVIVLSVFNGFDDLIKTLYSTFDPEIRITASEGKSFSITDSTSEALSKVKGVASWSKITEENALLRYGEKQYIATLKGVDDNYSKVHSFDTLISQGHFILSDSGQNYAVVGQGVAYYLQVGLQLINPIMVYVPRKGVSISVDPSESFNRMYIYPSGIFVIEQEIDSKYVIVPIQFMHELLEDSSSITSIEIRASKNADIATVHHDIKNIIGDGFKVEDRYQQKEIFYRIMKYEKLAIFLILSFILMVASFNVIGSLAMLIIEKKKDISTLSSLGADNSLIERIFITEGLFISLVGAVTGLLLGLLVCWLQIKYGLVPLGGSGSFIINAYPVSVKFSDIILIFLTVTIIGILVAWFPVRFIIRRYLTKPIQ